MPFAVVCGRVFSIFFMLVAIQRYLLSLFFFFVVAFTAMFQHQNPNVCIIYYSLLVLFMTLAIVFFTRNSKNSFVLLSIYLYFIWLYILLHTEFLVNPLVTPCHTALQTTRLVH